MRIRIASKYINQRKYLLQENRRHWCIHEGIYSHLLKHLKQNVCRQMYTKWAVYFLLDKLQLSRNDKLNI